MSRISEALSRVHQAVKNDPDYPVVCYTTSVVAASEAGLKTVGGTFETDFPAPNGQTKQPHHWCEGEDGTIHDLTAVQFNEYMAEQKFVDGVNTITPEDSMYERYSGQEIEVSTSMFARAWNAIFG